MGKAPMAMAMVQGKGGKQPMIKAAKGKGKAGKKGGQQGPTSGPRRLQVLSTES